MAILVDQPLWTFRDEKWSHLVSDSNYDELHHFANRLGIRRIGFQGDHYDLPERLLASAMAQGAQQVDSRDLVRRLREANLRKSPKHQAWTPLARLGQTSVEHASQQVLDALRSDSSDGRDLALIVEGIWDKFAGAARRFEQVFALSTTTQIAVAFDTATHLADLGDLLHLTTLTGAADRSGRAEVWVTPTDLHTAVDVLLTRSA